MRKIDIDKLLLVMLISFGQVNGLVFEGFFLVILCILILRNGKNIRKNKYYKFFILVIICYCILMAIQCVHQNKGTEIARIYGITKCMCAISLCVLFSDRVCKKDVYSILFWCLVLFNFIAAGAEITGVSSIGNVEFVLRNSTMCMNLLFWPHIFILKHKLGKKWIPYVVSLGTLFYAYHSRSFLLGMVLFIFMWVIYILGRNRGFTLSKHAKKKKWISRVLLIVVLSILVSFLVSDTIRSFYLVLLATIDVSRVEIISYGILRRSSLNQFERIWGSGEILYPVAYGRMIQAHNFVIEALTMYGIAGVIVLLVDIAVFWVYIFKQKLPRNVLLLIFYSIALCYLDFFAHPFYSTSFIIKIFLVLINMNAIQQFKLRINKK